MASEEPQGKRPSGLGCLTAAGRGEAALCQGPAPPMPSIAKPLLQNLMHTNQGGPDDTFRELETFICVARLGSFTATAQRLHASQPAISMRIRELEFALGVALLDRSTTGIRLTNAGRTCMRYAERMLALRAELRYRAGDTKTLAGIARMGVSEFIAVTWLPALIARLAAEYPEISVELDVDENIMLQRRFRKARTRLHSSRHADPPQRVATNSWASCPSAGWPARHFGCRAISSTRRS